MNRKLNEKNSTVIAAQIKSILFFRNVVKKSISGLQFTDGPRLTPKYGGFFLF
jgi:hypothetical protein